MNAPHDAVSGTVGTHGTTAGTAEVDIGVGVAGVRFPRDARLLDGKSFTPVFRRSRRFTDRYWTLLVHEPDAGAATGAKLGLAIAKKRAKRAVDRNRIKRVARESFRHRRAALDGRHVVAMNRDPAGAAGAAELRAAIEVLWDKVIRASST